MFGIVDIVAIISDGRCSFFIRFDVFESIEQWRHEISLPKLFFILF